MRIVYDTKQFQIDMRNIMDYCFGYVDGIKEGKTKFNEKFAQLTVKALKDFIDTNARVDPKLYHHIYEWNQVGDPGARLYNVRKQVSDEGFTLNYYFSQSRSIPPGGTQPFYDKAKIMESGTAVTIKPTNASALAFIANNQLVFTKKEVIVTDPGGPLVKGSFQKTIDLFFKAYFKQSFMISSGITEYIKNPKAFRSNFSQSKRGGYSLGKKVGYTWISMEALSNE